MNASGKRDVLKAKGQKNLGNLGTICTLNPSPETSKTVLVVRDHVHAERVAVAPTGGIKVPNPVSHLAPVCVAWVFNLRHQIVVLVTSGCTKGI